MSRIFASLADVVLCAEIVHFDHIFCLSVALDFQVALRILVPDTGRALLTTCRVSRRVHCVMQDLAPVIIRYSMGANGTCQHGACAPAAEDSQPPVALSVTHTQLGSDRDAISWPEAAAGHSTVQTEM